MFIRSKFFNIGITWFLVLSISSTLSISARVQDEEDPLGQLKKLESRFDAAFKAEAYQEGLVIAEEMYGIILSKHVTTLYNIALLNEKLGQRERAYVWFEQAANTSYWHVRFRLRESNDFKEMQKEERFKSIMRGAWLKNYIFMLERPERADFQKPLEVMAALELRPGERVADLGAGSGYFTIPMARAVGPDGVVWATDLYQDLLDHIEKRAKEEKLENVRPLKVPKDDPCLPAGGVDTVLMVDAYHYLEDRPAYNKKLKKCLAPGGRVVVIDSIPKPQEERMPGYPKPHVEISRETLDKEMAAAGLVPIKVHDFLPEQYFVEYGVN